MCFIISYTRGGKPQPIVADHDIECYKAATLRDNILAAPTMCVPYLNVKYHKSVTMTAKITPKIYYKNVVRCSEIWNCMSIDEGIHAFTKLKRVKAIRRFDREPLTVVHCIIPKGTLYYSDGYDYVVAEKMIIYNPFTIEK